MKIALVVHGFPPENLGGTELSTHRLALELLRSGHEVLVIAGSMRWEEGFRESAEEERDERSGKVLRVRRIHRADLYFDHWQKSRSPSAGELFQQMVREERPDLVHLHHWIRLTRDAIHRAALEGLPSVATLHDFWTTCLVAHRLPPGSSTYCELPLEASSCVPCAGSLAPRTPWLGGAELDAELERRRVELERELRLARRVLVLSHDQARRLRRLGRTSGIDYEVLPLGSELELAPHPTLPLPHELGVLRLGCWGTLARAKGQDLLIDALDRLPPTSCSIELHFAGIEGDAAFVAELRARSRGRAIFFHGPFPRGGLASSPVAAVHAMVHTSHYAETWGLVVDEAAALGLPMILPAGNALEEHVGGADLGAAFYAPGDASALAVEIRRCCEDREHLPRLRSQVAVLRRELPTWKDHIERLECIYAAAIAAGPPEVARLDPASELREEERIRSWDGALARCTKSELGFPP